MKNWISFSLKVRLASEQRRWRAKNNRIHTIAFKEGKLKKSRKAQKGTRTPQR